MPLVGKKKGSSNAGTACLATTSPPMVPEICASAVPASAENPAAVARIATIVPSLDVCIGCPSVDLGATDDAGDGGGIPRPMLSSPPPPPPARGRKAGSTRRTGPSLVLVLDDDSVTRASPRGGATRRGGARCSLQAKLRQQ